MKKITLLAFLINSFVYAQLNPNPGNTSLDLSTNSTATPITSGLSSVMQPNDLVYECDTVFWTTSTTGEIRQWNLIGNQVTGGNVVLTGGGPGLAFGGPADNLTLYSSGSTNAVKKYNFTTLAWETMPTAYNTVNIGAYHEAIYCMYGLSSLYYFDGINLNAIPNSTAPNLYGTADIAVDSSGNAWVFLSNDNGMIYCVQKFNASGLLATYNFGVQFSSNGCYGSFFINDKLYVGRTDGIIIPIDINGTSASTGTSIPFPYNNYGDMASCNRIAPLNVPDIDLTKITISPNPTKDIFNINTNENISSIVIYSIDGKLVKTIHDSKSIDISDLADSTYLLKITSEKNTFNKFIVKKS